ncbi:TetR/AcrR family transcriptional regulator [Amycolatopsis sp. lyj-23]|uniref:TetR/AcrR family transcriptional regulator n=1 Tax=Amycolatopsis sp. lyj-23 TaxID=2789283 RepID=UPI00397CADA9
MAGQAPTRSFADVARAAAQVFTRRGYREAGISDVAKELGLSHGALYTYVQSKEAPLYVALAWSIDPDLLDGLETPVRLSSEEEIVALARRWTEAEGFPRLAAASGRRRVESARAEFGEIIDELYSFIEHNRDVLALVAQCARELPEMFQFWFVQRRRGHFDARNGWPNLAMARVLSDRSGGPLGSLAQLPLLPLPAGPPLIVLCVLGVRRLGWGPGRDHRWALAVVVTAVVVFTLGGGKPYYPAPALIALFAAGAVRAEATSRGRRRWPAVIVLSGLIAVLIGYPALPARGQNALRAINPTVMETFGWPEFADQVRAAESRLPPATPIFTSNYGEAGALTIDGGFAGPILSGQNAYSFWEPPAGRPDTVLCVGEFKLSYLRRFWSDVREVGPITMPDGIGNQETDHHAAIYECREPQGTWQQLWPSLRHFD